MKMIFKKMIEAVKEGWRLRRNYCRAIFSHRAARGCQRLAGGRKQMTKALG